MLIKIFCCIKTGDKITEINQFLESKLTCNYKKRDHQN